MDKIHLPWEVQKKEPGLYSSDGSLVQALPVEFHIVDSRGALITDELPEHYARFIVDAVNKRDGE